MPMLVPPAGAPSQEILSDQTRARAPARERKGITIRRVYAPPGERRTPLVLVELERDGLRLIFAVARLRGGALDVRPPRLPDGTPEPGVWFPQRERDRIAALILEAVKAEPAALDALRGRA